MKLEFLPLIFLLTGAGIAAGPAPTPQARIVGACRQAGLGGTDLVRWVKRTVTDTSSYAQMNRAMSGLSQGDSSTVVMVADSATCAALSLRFAREVAGRDTVNAADVYAVAVGATHWVVTDYTPLESPVDSLPDGTPVHRTGPQVMPTLTVDQATGAAKVWHFLYLRPAGAKY